ncbi:MAG: serine hydrolase [Planctomycetota bacterium]
MRTAFLVLIVFVFAFDARSQDVIQPGLIGEILRDPSLLEHDGVRAIVDDPQTYRLQILLGEVLDTPQGPTIRRSGYRLESAYFYPASTIKLFAAASALELLGTIDDADADTPLAIWPPDGEGAEGGGPDASDDSNANGGLITAAHEIRKLFVVSDNRAFNRLYDLVGHERLNTSAREAGFDGVVINHRLAIARTAEQNRAAPRVVLGGEDGAVSVIEPRVSEMRIDDAGVPGLEVGSAELIGGDRLERPKNFVRSNRAELRALQDSLISILRPELVPEVPGYALTESDRSLLRESMTWLPRECPNPTYDPETYPDDWAKFMLEGIREVVPADAIRYSNKIGLAYGFTTETAYIEDQRSGRGFFLAGTVYTNENETLNDNVYEYDTKAMPFWRALGRVAARRLLLNADGWKHDATSLQVGEPVGTTLGEWIIEPESTFTNAVVSFNAVVADGGFVRADVAVPSDGDWSEWMPIADWGKPQGVATLPTSWPGGRIAIDELIADDPIDRLRVRIVASAGDAGSWPALHRVDVVTSRRDRDRVLDASPGDAITVDAPFQRTAIDDDPSLASRLCSPTSLGMLLAHRGQVPDYREMIDRVYDAKHDLYGVWPRAIQAAFSYGVPGRLHRFGCWTEVRAQLANVGPIAISLRAAEGEVRGMDYDASEGHIIVLIGLNEQGDAIVLDPAFSTESEARRVYPAHDLSEVWLRRARGTAYVLLPAIDP